MKYKNVVKGSFISRINRFSAYVEINQTVYTVHVKNTGRCKEFLINGATVYLYKSDNPKRKTLYDIIAVEKHTACGILLINFDSQAANETALEFLNKGLLFSSNSIIKREVTFGNSRFDFYIEDGTKKAFLEVKGVTLENNGIAYFPDAPTDRGVKHLNELIKCKEEGYEAYILFVVQMKGVHLLKPNDSTHKVFGDTLRHAKESGVNILAIDCIINPDSIEPGSYVDVELN